MHSSEFETICWKFFCWRAPILIFFNGFAEMQINYCLYIINVFIICSSTVLQSFCWKWLHKTLRDENRFKEMAHKHSLIVAFVITLLTLRTWGQSSRFRMFKMICLFLSCQSETARITDFFPHFIKYRYFLS